MRQYNPLLSLLAMLLGGFVVAVLVGGIITAVLAAGDTGDPAGKCRNAEFDLENAGSVGLRDAVTSQQLAEQWQRRWDEFNAQLDAGSSASVTFEEGEVTSRAAQWVDETDAPLKDVTVCFYDGTAEARARAEMPVLADVPLLGGAFEADVRILGRIETEGGVARVTITEIDAGDIPDWATGPVEDDLEEIVNSRLDDYDVGHTYTVTYRERQIEIVGTP